MFTLSSKKILQKVLTPIDVKSVDLKLALKLVKCHILSLGWLMRQKRGKRLRTVNGNITTARAGAVWGKCNIIYLLQIKQ